MQNCKDLGVEEYKVELMCVNCKSVRFKEPKRQRLKESMSEPLKESKG